MYQFHCLQSGCGVSLRTPSGVLTATRIARLGPTIRPELRCPQLAGRRLLLDGIA
jgi:hypothetical protein